jgi:rfaE bifunctional protein nucleotidyltransferase chain/domain
MKVVFTNGCFDVLHPGHVDLLERARALGDRLVVGLNSDASVRALKGPGRPIYPQGDRVLMLRALRSVDEVLVFDEPTPARLIEELSPDVLVKGGDWPVDRIVGAGRSCRSLSGDRTRRRGLPRNWPGRRTPSPPAKPCPPRKTGCPDWPTRPVSIG